MYIETRLQYFLGGCHLEAVAWGYDDPVRDGYLKVNSVVKAEMSVSDPYRGIGFHLVQFDKHCMVVDTKHFDTYRYGWVKH